MYTSSGNATARVEGQLLTMASRPKRLVGAILDALVLTALLYPILLATGLADRLRVEQTLSMTDWGIFTLMVWGLFTLIHAHFLIRYGQTIGKRLVGSQIVDQEGNIPPLERIILLRYFLFGALGLIPYLGLGIQIMDKLYIFSSDHRCLHDHVAGTVVVEVGPAPLWPWPSEHGDAPGRQDRELEDDQG